ncbi:metalloenzyme [candidate division LCP-89 bacterium B3_LCP]|uniref:Metalloenzyme n=1 Tax=candidate division LCP-89 bacterium B3_LCP TaxID=2012998 RepID=A0A532V552_UNCL8|nr:MAG: metalloenzyme [candidate division LCP-89 bacterium B3_LCP]
MKSHYLHRLNMLKASRKILLIFIDGLGIGEDDPRLNPLLHHPDIWPAKNHKPDFNGLSNIPIDACLGVEGLPQSATGQTALLTGINAPKLVGKHLQGFPSRKLIELLKNESIFVHLTRNGYNATFANAYRHPEDITPFSRLSVTSHAFKASGQPFRSVEQIEKREALYHDFTNRSLGDKWGDIPILSAQEAADILVGIAKKEHFTLYEHFMTDILGHKGDKSAILSLIRQLSDFIHSTLTLANEEGIKIIITSDHGNIEDSSVKTHTRNSVPFIWNFDSEIIDENQPERITDVIPLIKKILIG